MADLVPMSQAATTSLVTTLQNTDLFALAREDNTSETGYRSKVARVDAVAKKVVNETDYSQLQTTDKKIIGAINEVNGKASQKADKSDIASISIIGSVNNTGNSISIGTFFYLNDEMVKSIAVIANGATLVEDTNYIVANDSVNDINAYESLTITRTENTLVDATSLTRCLAYKRGRINGFYCNLQIAGGITTNDFVEIGRISGWVGVHKLLDNIVCQSSTFGMIVLQIDTDGKISVYSPMPTVSGFYRFNCLMV